MEFIDYDSDVVLLILSLLSTVSLEGLPMVVEISSEYLLVWSSIGRRVKLLLCVNDSASESTPRRSILGVGIRGNKLLQLEVITTAQNSPFCNHDAFNFTVNHHLLFVVHLNRLSIMINER